MASEGRSHDSRMAAAALVALGKAGVPRLISALKSNDSWVVRSAARSLGRLGDGRAVDPLLGLLARGSARGDGVETVVRSLGELGDPKAAGPVGRILMGDDHTSPGFLADALAKFGPAGWKHLAEALKHGNGDIRTVAGAALKRTEWKPANRAEQAWYLVAQESWDKAAALGPEAVRALARGISGRRDDPAVAALVRMGNSAVEPLIAIVGDRKTPHRIAIIGILGRIGDKRAIGPLRTLLTDSEWGVDKAAGEALAKLGPASLDTYAKALKSKDVSERRAAVKAVAGIPDKGVVPLLTAALKDEDRYSRLYAARALAGRRDPRAIGALVEAMQSDRERDVRQEAGKALLAAGSPAIDALIKALQTGDGLARYLAVKALGETGDKRVVPHLVRHLVDSDHGAAQQAEFYLRTKLSWSPTTLVERVHVLIAKGSYASALRLGKAAAVEPLCGMVGFSAQANVKLAACLAQSGDPRAVKALIPLLETKDADNCVLFIRALVKLGDTRAAAPLVALLDRYQQSMAREAKKGVIALWDAKAFPAVAKMLNDGRHAGPRLAMEIMVATKDPRAVDAIAAMLKRHWGDEFRLAVIKALGDLGDVRAVKVLTETMKDEEKSIRQAAAAALAKLRAKKE